MNWRPVKRVGRADAARQSAMVIKMENMIDFVGYGKRMCADG